MPHVLAKWTSKRSNHKAWQATQRARYLCFVFLTSATFTPAYPSDEPGSAVDLLFVGDTSFGENYQARLKQKGKASILETKGYDYTIENFSSILLDVSFVIANLETPITDVKPSPLAGRKHYLHYSDVRFAPALLKRYHIGLVSLANNHTLDYGLDGLSQTRDLLHTVGIETCGAGSNEAQARKPYIRESGIGEVPSRVAVLCAFEYREKYESDYGFYARGAKGGVNDLSAPALLQGIASLNNRPERTYVVLFIHWGKNYAWKTKKQSEWAHALIDAGADLIIGHGAHMLQEVEQYKGRWIVYSLGNFVFNSPGRYAKRDAPPYGLIARLMLENNEGKVVKRLRLYPIFTDNRVTDYHSRFVSAAEFTEVRRLLIEEHDIRGTFAANSTTGRDKFGWFFESRLR